MSSVGIGELPNPGRSTAITRWSPARTGTCSSQLRHEPDRPWTKTSGGPSPMSIVLRTAPSTATQR